MFILKLLFTIIIVIVGIVSSVGILVLLFGTIGYKIYRKIKYGISLYD